MAGQENQENAVLLGFPASLSQTGRRLAQQSESGEKKRRDVRVCSGGRQGSCDVLSCKSLEMSGRPTGTNLAGFSVSGRSDRVIRCRGRRMGWAGRPAGDAGCGWSRYSRRLVARRGRVSESGLSRTAACWLLRGVAVVARRVGFLLANFCDGQSEAKSLTLVLSLLAVAGRRGRA